MCAKDPFQRYLDLADVLGTMFAPFVEVIVHDLRTPDSSIIAIYNGHITGRSVGDGTTDLGLRRINGEVPDKIINYKNESPSGLALKSSTLAIRDHKDRIIGSFALNMNIDYFAQVSKLLDPLLATETPDFLPSKENYGLGNSQEKITAMIQEYALKHGISYAMISPKQRKAVIEYLVKHGIFELKHAISIVSKTLNISRPTVYKYLDQFNQRT